jgi:2-amino-4-hydroxy-6-hydroxymethyldihydropteridine diphosphokinase
LGDRLGNCTRGVEALTGDGRVRVAAQSRIYQTEPVDFTRQDWFINYVIQAATVLEPLALLDCIRSVELGLGRTRAGVRYGPRVLDMDILLYDALVLNHPRLTLPHPRMHLRRFVLIPLCDITPAVMHPVLGKDARSLLAALSDRGQEVVEFR